MDKIVINNISGDTLTILGIEILDSASYTIPGENIIAFSKDAYLIALLTYSMIDLSIYGLIFIADTGTTFMNRVASGNVVFA